MKVFVCELLSALGAQNVLQVWANHVNRSSEYREVAIAPMASGPESRCTKHNQGCRVVTIVAGVPTINERCCLTKLSQLREQHGGIKPGIPDKVKPNAFGFEEDVTLNVLRDEDLEEHILGFRVVEPFGCSEKELPRSRVANKEQSTAGETVTKVVA